MEMMSEVGENLSDIPTVWSDINEAHQEGPEARLAQERIVRRYGPAVLRYLFVLARDVEAASELFQQFAKGLIEGRMRRADPARGKFRNYLKTTLVNLVHDHRRRLMKDPLHYMATVPEPAAHATPITYDSDREFLDIWRNDLLKAAFDELLSIEQRTKRPHYTVLDLRLRFADARTEQLAQMYTEQTGRPVAADRMRKLLFEARKAFSDVLLGIVEQTLDQPGLHEVEEELIELGLLGYCKDAISRRRAP